MKHKLTFILPSNKDGGGNRWSYMLASNLAKNSQYDVEFIMPEIENFKNIYLLDKKVNLKTFRTRNFFKIYSIFKIILFLKKNINKERIIIVSDPILSIFMFLFKNRTIRNVASDDYNLFNYTKYKFFGLVQLYKVLTFFSFFYKNVNFVFNSVYTYKKIFHKMKFPIKLLNAQTTIIHPFINNIYLNSPIHNSNKEKAIAIFPRKHNFKGFKMIAELNKIGTLKKLGIDKIYLVYNKSEHLPEFEHLNFTLVNPKNDSEIIKILDKCICFISTSTSEGFGLPPLEAMARKCIPIVVDAGGTATFCFNLYNCLISKPNDIESLKNNINLIFNNDKLRKRIEENLLFYPNKFSEINGTKYWHDYITKNFDESPKKYKTKFFSSFAFEYFNKFFLIFQGMDLRLKIQIFFEFIFLPFLIIKNIIINYFHYFLQNKKVFNIRVGEENSIALCIQDWVNYDDVRTKELKNGTFYECGIRNQYKKFISKKYSISKFLYISKAGNIKKKYSEYIDNGFDVVYNGNDYLDFSSYSNFYDKNKDKDILIFMNSSVSTEFNQPIIDSYVDYFKKNKDIGLFGISANSKKYQTIVPFGFEPHIQSIFFITTKNILEKIISKNKGFFPGTNVTKNNKYRLIIDGEIKLNNLVLNLGYSIAFVDEYGEVIKYNKSKMFNCKFFWKKPFGDLRLITNYPSQANYINNI